MSMSLFMNDSVFLVINDMKNCCLLQFIHSGNLNFLLNKTVSDLYSGLNSSLLEAVLSMYSSSASNSICGGLSCPFVFCILTL